MGLRFGRGLRTSRYVFGISTDAEGYHLTISVVRVQGRLAYITMFWIGTYILLHSTMLHLILNIQCKLSNFFR